MARGALAEEVHGDWEGGVDVAGGAVALVHDGEVVR